MKPMTPQRYLKAISLMAGLAMGLVALINYFVDPYTYFGTNTLGIHIIAERQLKPLGVIRNPNKAILIGNSKTGMVDVGQLQGPAPFFNASVGGLMPEEMLYLVENLSPNAPLVVIGLDYIQFNTQRDWIKHPFPEIHARERLTYLFSHYAFVNSMRTLIAAIAGEDAKIKADGSFNAEGWFRHYDQENPLLLEIYWNDLQERLADLSISENRLQLLDQVKAELDKKNVPYLIFLNPVHHHELELIREHGQWETFDYWRHEVLKRFPNAIDLSESHYGSPEYFFRSDPLHFYPQTGIDFLNERVLPALSAE